tara:strand:- start:3525 stop:4457 length:933 start_codon:yes stop_codon:yes gene_type:complete
MLNSKDRNYLIKSFPNIELFYEKIQHKNVHSPSKNSNIIGLTIPKGNKYFAWFRNFRQKPTCILFMIDRRNKKFKSIEIKTCCFDKTLCNLNGTILFGTIFKYENLNFFNIENIYQYKGKQLTSQTQYSRILLCQTMMNESIKQTYYSKNSIIFGLPFINTDRKKIMNVIKKTPYDIYCIQYRQLYTPSVFLNEKINIQKNLTKNFTVKANGKTEIYHLYNINNFNETSNPISTACIPDYKTSVLMNTIFRRIVENEDLDKIEESEDEEDFENIDDFKYTDTNKTIVMECQYNATFKSWVPYKVINKFPL